LWQTVPNRWLVGLTFGALVSSDQGETFHWICEDAVGGVTGADPIVAVPDANTLVIGNARGLFVSRDGGCNWQTHAQMAPPAQVGALAIDPSDAATWLVAENTPAYGRGRLWRTRDSGKTYAQVQNVGKAMYIYAAAISAVNPSRWVIVGGNNRAHDSCPLYVSDDAGQTWHGGPIAAAPDAAAKPRVVLHPLDPEQMLVASLDVTTNGSRILRSTDGGRTFSIVLRIPEPTVAMAYEADGDSVFVAGTHHLYGSSNQGKSFEPAEQPTGNACVATHGRQVYACGAEGLDHFSLASRFAKDEDFEGVFRLDAMQGPYHCKAGSQVYDMCAPLWPEQAQMIGAVAAIPEADAP
jgi:photosystem II stability/assembly factor-like uncharacterized protein